VDVFCAFFALTPHANLRCFVICDQSFSVLTPFGCLHAVTLTQLLVSAGNIIFGLRLPLPSPMNPKVIRTLSLAKFHMQ
jgi:hypothetical protein